MKIIFRIKSKANPEKEIKFGEPDSKEELDEMFRLRYSVYLAKNHIEPNEEKMDLDHLDKENKCKYFIAKNNGNLVGAARVIQDDYLPTEREYFDLKEPIMVKVFSRKRRIEVGRIISIHYDEFFLPPRLTLLGLFKCITEYSKENGLMVGYGTLKGSVREKLLKIRFPIHDVKNHKLKINPKESSDPLIGFFTDLSDPVWPVYYSRFEAQLFFWKVFHNKALFIKQSDNCYFLNDDLITTNKIT